MGDVDAGNVKAKASIEYDGSGLKQMKEDLQSLPSMVGGLGDSAEKAGEALSGLDESMAGSAGSAKSFTTALSELPKITESGTSTISAMTGALSEHQSAVEETGAAYESLQKPVSETVSLFQDAAPQMASISKQAGSMQEQLSSFGDSWGTAGYNMQVFQEALQSPEPFNMIYDHLDRTGQSIEGFTSSIGESNAELYHQMSTDWAQTNAWVDEAGKSYANLGSSAKESFSMVASSADDASSAVAEFLGTGEKAGKGGGMFGGLLGGAGASEDVVSPFMGFLNDIMMPLMAVQMVGYAIGAIGQGIYDNAVIAEGSSAHMAGSFTGAVDTMNASMNKAKQTFSEGFGQGTLPSLEGMNNANNNPNGGIDWGSFGYGLGTETGIVGDILGFVGGGILSGAAKVLTLNPSNTFGDNIWQGSLQGLQNYWAGFTGQPLPYPGPPPPIMNPMQQQIDQLNALANNPEYLAAQASYQSAAGKAMQRQEAYDVSHYGGTTGPDDWQNEILQYQAVRAAGGKYGSLTDPNAIFFGWNDYLNGNEPAPPGCFPAGTPILLSDGNSKPIEAIQVDDIVFAHDGEQVVPTPVLALIRPPKKSVYKLVFSDGNTLTLTDSHPVSTEHGWKSISPEATKRENPGLQVTLLHVGDSVHTIDGACTLISITPLQGRVPVFNITVGEPHTFYAASILVHNKKLSNTISSNDIGQQTAEQIGGIQLPHIDLSGMAGQIAGSISGIEMPHLDLSGITGSLGSAFSGISMPAIPDIGSQISGALGGMFSGITMPAIPDIGGEISGALGGMFGGIAMPSIPDIGGEISGALSGVFGGISMPSPPDVGAMLNGAMSGIFGGIQPPDAPDVGAMINGAMSGMFGGIQIPTPPNLGAMISSSMSGMFSGISLPSVPFFASGVENFSGGPAWIAENGPELVTLPPGASVYPLSAGSAVGGANMTPLSLGGNAGGGGNSAPQSMNIFLQIDGQTFWSATGMSLAQDVRAASGNRSY